MVPHVRDKTPLGMQKTFALELEKKGGLVRAARETSKFHIYHSRNSRLRNMAGILPILCITQINQSNQVSRNVSYSSMFGRFLKTNQRMLLNISIIFFKLLG